MPAVGKGGGKDDDGPVCGRYGLPLLLFPKPFEMFSFLAGIKEVENAWINDVRLYDVKMFRLTCKHTDLDIKFMTYVHSLDSSDIDFSNKLGKFIRDFSSVAPNADFHITLAGTCGGSFKSGRQVGQAFRITKAIKFDRGSLSRNDDGSFVLSIDKSNMALTNTSTNISWAETILSCNHVVCVDPVEFAPFLKLDESECTLCDMETYDFFSTCHSMEVVRYDCVRVVSDVFQVGSNRDLEKLVRKHVNMTSILDLLLKQALECALELQYEPYQVPGEVARKNHENLLQRMQNSIEKVRSSLIKSYKAAYNPEFDITELMPELTFSSDQCQCPPVGPVGYQWKKHLQPLPMVVVVAGIMWVLPILWSWLMSLNVKRAGFT
eukprot:scaffold6875_cov159-Ochromonas_danica.AAC.2